MNAWVVRGLGLALIHVFVRTVLGVSITQWPLQGSTLRWIALVVVILAAVAWAGIDGIRDRRAHPNPDDGADLTMTWLKAGLLGGIVAGVLSSILSLVPSLNVTQNTFFFEITSGAAFTVLLIFVSAMLAVTCARFFVDRELKNSPVASAPPVPAATDGYGDSDADTTVFEAVKPEPGDAPWQDPADLRKTDT